MPYANTEIHLQKAEETELQLCLTWHLKKSKTEQNFKLNGFVTGVKVF